MGPTLSIVLPIFGLVALGYGVVRSGYLAQSAADGLNAFVLSVAMPVLLFRTLSTAGPGGPSPVLLWAVYFTGVVIVFVAAAFLARRHFGLDRRTSVIAGVSTAYSNLVLVSLPVIERVYGREGIDILALLVAVHLPVMVVGSMLLVEAGIARDAREAPDAAAASAGYVKTLARVSRSLARHPLFIAALVGLTFRFTGLTTPGALGEVVDTIAAMAGPLALLALGASLPRYRIGREFGLPLLLGTLALVVQPAIVYAVGVAFLPPLWLGVAVLGAAAPSGINAYILAVHFRTGETIAATMAVGTTAASLLSLTLWVAILSA